MEPVPDQESLTSELLEPSEKRVYPDSEQPGAIPSASRTNYSQSGQSTRGASITQVQEAYGNATSIDAPHMGIEGVEQVEETNNFELLNGFLNPSTHDSQLQGNFGINFPTYPHLNIPVLGAPNDGLFPNTISNGFSDSMNELNMQTKTYDELLRRSFDRDLPNLQAPNMHTSPYGAPLPENYSHEFLNLQAENPQTTTYSAPVQESFVQGSPPPSKEEIFKGIGLGERGSVTQSLKNAVKLRKQTAKRSHRVQNEMGLPHQGDQAPEIKILEYSMRTDDPISDNSHRGFDSEASTPSTHQSSASDESDEEASRSSNSTNDHPPGTHASAPATLTSAQPINILNSGFAPSQQSENLQPPVEVENRRTEWIIRDGMPTYNRESSSKRRKAGATSPIPEPSLRNRRLGAQRNTLKKQTREDSRQQGDSSRNHHGSANHPILRAQIYNGNEGNAHGSLPRNTQSYGNNEFGFQNGNSSSFNHTMMDFTGDSQFGFQNGIPSFFNQNNMTNATSSNSHVSRNGNLFGLQNQYGMPRLHANNDVGSHNRDAFPYFAIQNNMANFVGNSGNARTSANHTQSRGITGHRQSYGCLETLSPQTDDSSDTDTMLGAFSNIHSRAGRTHNTVTQNGQLPGLL